MTAVAGLDSFRGRTGVFEAARLGTKLFGSSTRAHAVGNQKLRYLTKVLHQGQATQPLNAGGPQKEIRTDQGSVHPTKVGKVMYPAEGTSRYGAKGSEAGEVRLVRSRAGWATRVTRTER